MAKVNPSDLIACGLLEVDEALTLTNKGVKRSATLLADGRIRLDDGSVFSSLSTAAGAVTGSSTNGWPAWRVVRLGMSMADVRAEAATSV